MFNATRRILFLVLLTCMISTTAAQEKSRVDLDGEPVPERAICRLGSKRFLHGGEVTAAAFSPDGKRFVSVGKRVIIREWPSGKILKKTDVFDATKMRFSPDGTLLTFDSGPFCRFFNIDTDELLTFEAGSPDKLPVFFPKDKRAA